MKTEQRQWQSLSGVSVKWPIAKEITERIEREMTDGYHIKVCNGTDGKVKDIETEFASVIVLVKKQKDGLMYMHNKTTTQSMSIHERMHTEVVKSIEVAYPLCNIFSRCSVDIEVQENINTHKKQYLVFEEKCN